MAMSPRITKIWLESREVAALMAGIELDDIPKRVKELRYCSQIGERHPDPQVRKFRDWWLDIMFDVALGLLPARRFSGGQLIGTSEQELDALLAGKWHDDEDTGEDNQSREGDIYDGERIWIRQQDWHARLAERDEVANEKTPNAIITHSEAPQDKPLVNSQMSEQQQADPRRQSYLTLVEGLALETLGGEIPKQPYKAAGQIISILERHGLKLDKGPIADTIRELHTHPKTTRDKPLYPRRRQSYLTLIEGLALKVVGGEVLEKPDKATTVLQEILERHELQMDAAPIADILGEIQDIREERKTERS